MGSESSKVKKILTAEEWEYLSGDGIDIGCGMDPITDTCDRFDVQDGDANHITKYVNKVYDWVYSSHCLEHLNDPEAVLKEWGQLVRSGGYLIVVIPDEDLYEQGIWPSRYNGGHKHTFTLSKRCSWSPVSINVLGLISKLTDFNIVNVELQDIGYDRSLRDVDQTRGAAMANIMFILKKK